MWWLQSKQHTGLTNYPAQHERMSNGWTCILVTIWLVIALLVVLPVFAEGRQPFQPVNAIRRDDQALPAIERVVVIKSERVLRLMAGDVVVKEYEIALGGQPKGPKQCEGDSRTPEGNYVLDYRNPASQFYKSIHVSYPNDEDRRGAKELGCDPGGDIMIHGLPPAWSMLGQLHRAVDWTLGCIAVTNAEIDEIWGAVSNGTPIEIRQ